MPPFSTRGSIVARALCLSLLGAGVLHAQAVQNQTQPSVSGEPLVVDKVDPPNWFSGLPKPLLLLHGTGLTGAHFTLSDRALHLVSASVSANGHWAQLQLSAAPAAAESIEIQIDRAGAKLRVPYKFEARRASNNGMQGFSGRDAIYLIMTDRFADGDPHNDSSDAHSEAPSPAAVADRAKPRGWHGGDLQGVIQHLDYLQELGFTAVWITPVYTNGPSGYHGYSITDHYGVDPHLGTLSDLQQLAKALHTRGMKLILDTVPNHVGAAHPWVADEPTPDWFHGTKANHIPATFNFETLINPHAPERDRLNTLHGWFSNSLPDMNTEDPVVAQYLRQNAVWWIEKTGADGLRIDTFAFVNRSFWHDYNGELAELYPHLTEVGEIFNSHPEITSAFADGVTRSGPDTRLYTPFDFPTYSAIRSVFAEGKPMSALADVLGADALYPHPERLVPFAGNHDTSRFAQVVSDPALREIAFAYLLTTRGTPQIYSGDEIAMHGGNDPANRADFPGGFAGSDHNAFSAAGRTPEEQRSYAWIKQLLSLRHDHEVLACGDEQVLAAKPDAMVYARFDLKGCAKSSGRGAPATAAPVPLVILLQRNGVAPITVDLRNTALEGCTPRSPILGEAETTLKDGQLTITPHGSVVVLPCGL
jgi:glycosidase